VSRGVLCVGDNTIDRYLPPLDVDLVGGGAVNVAAALVRAGLDVAYAGSIGADDDGAFVRRQLEGAGIDLSLVEEAPGRRTAVTEIAVAPNGERSFPYEDYAIHEAWEPADAVWDAARAARLVHGSRIPQHLARLRALDGPAVAYDFSDLGVPDDLSGLDVAICSGGLDPEALVARGARVGVVTRGAAGSAAATATERAEQPAARVREVVDTCGAGDAFIGGLLAARLRGEPLAACLAAGAEAAARICETVGGFPQAAR
jgi:fructoselysine 6-kinase